MPLEENKIGRRIYKAIVHYIECEKGSHKRQKKMPDIRIYLPDEMYIRFKQEESNKSQLIQQLLTEYWKVKEQKKKKK